MHVKPILAMLIKGDVTASMILARLFALPLLLLLPIGCRASR